MKITEIVWLTKFVEKIERKHGVSADEVEQVLSNSPRFRLIERRSYGNRKAKAKAPKHRDLLPAHFSSVEEAAEFWVTHDSAAYDEYMRDVEGEIDIRQRTYLISLDGDLYRKVRAIATEKGVPAEKLVKLWIEEKAS